MNYQEQSSEESLTESEDDFRSPQRPAQSPSASPRSLLIPDPPHTAEVLEQAANNLQDPLLLAQRVGVETPEVENPVAENPEELFHREHKTYYMRVYDKGS